MTPSATKTISFTESVESFQLQLSHDLVQCINLQTKLLSTLYKQESCVGTQNTTQSEGSVST